MKTRRKIEHESLDEQIQNGVASEFDDVAGQVAQELVKRVSTRLASSFTGPLKGALDRLEKADLAKIESTIREAFCDKQMGVRGLASLARKEIAIAIIKRAVPKYKSDRTDDGSHPLDYFNQFYKNNFQKFEIPANGISVVDPNLHSAIKKRGQFPAITDSLNNG